MLVKLCHKWQHLLMTSSQLGGAADCSSQSGCLNAEDQFYNKRSGFAFKCAFGSLVMQPWTATTEKKSKLKTGISPSMSLCPSHLGVDGELDLVSLTEGVWDVHLQRGVRLQVHVHCPWLQTNKKQSDPLHVSTQTCDLFSYRTLALKSPHWMWCHYHAYFTYL